MVTRTFADYTGIINVQDYGALGDNSTDDYAAIQAAFDAACNANTGNERFNLNVYFPPGKYLVSQPITATLAGQKIYGGGHRISSIYPHGGQTDGVFITNGCAGVTFEGLTFGGGSSKTSGTGVVFDLGWDGVVATNLFLINFVSCAFGGGDILLRIGEANQGDTITITNCEFGESVVACIKTINFNSIGNTIIGCNLSQYTQYGIWMETGGFNMIAGCNFQAGVTENVSGPIDDQAYDIAVVNGAEEGLVVLGCSTESTNFLAVFGSVRPTFVAGCDQRSNTTGVFVNGNVSPINSCISKKGKVYGSGSTFMISDTNFEGSGTPFTSGQTGYVRMKNVFYDSANTFVPEGSWDGTDTLVLAADHKDTRELQVGALYVHDFFGSPYKRCRLSFGGLTLRESSQAIHYWGNDTAGPRLALAKSRGATTGTYSTIVADGDTLGTLSFEGSDGASDRFFTAGTIVGKANGTIAAGSIPGIVQMNFQATQLKAITYAQRPGTAAAGMVCYITDSTVATWGSTIAGGGANKVLAWYNGTNWTVAGA